MGGLGEWIPYVILVLAAILLVWGTVTRSSIVMAPLVLWAGLAAVVMSEGWPAQQRWMTDPMVIRYCLHDKVLAHEVGDSRTTRLYRWTCPDELKKLLKNSGRPVIASGMGRKRGAIADSEAEGQIRYTDLDMWDDGKQ